MERGQEEPYHITIEIVNRECEGLRTLEDLDIQQYTVDDIRGLPGGSTRHLIKVPSKQAIKVPSKQATEMPRDTFVEIRGGDKFGGKTSAFFDSDGCSVCRAILSHDSFTVSGRHVDHHTFIYSFVTSSFNAFKNIISKLEADGLNPKILEVAKFKPTRKILTERQERVLWLALKMGFFEFPRKITMLELSRRLGVGLSTVSEITRRGIRRLLEHHFET